MPHLTAHTDTRIRPRPDQLADLPQPPESYPLLRKGQTVKLLDASQVGKFVWVKFDNWIGPTEGFIYGPDITLTGNFKGNQPTEPKPTYSAALNGPSIQVPGIGLIPLNAPIVTGGNFTWNEATKGGLRIPLTENITDNVMRLADYLEQIRDVLGNQPMHITSWYRPPNINSRVGGSSKSTHIQGYAVDFQHLTLKPSQVYEILDREHGRNGGLAYTDTRGFTHIDLRNYRARWVY